MIIQDIIEKLNKIEPQKNKENELIWAYTGSLTLYFLYFHKSQEYQTFFNSELTVPPKDVDIYCFKKNKLVEKEIPLTNILIEKNKTTYNEQRAVYDYENKNITTIDVAYNFNFEYILPTEKDTTYVDYNGGKLYILRPEFMICFKIFGLFPLRQKDIIFTNTILENIKINPKLLIEYMKKSKYNELIKNGKINENNIIPLIKTNQIFSIFKKIIEKQLQEKNEYFNFINYENISYNQLILLWSLSDDLELNKENIESIINISNTTNFGLNIDENKLLLSLFTYKNKQINKIRINYIIKNIFCQNSKQEKMTKDDLFKKTYLINKHSYNLGQKSEKEFIDKMNKILSNENFYYYILKQEHKYKNSLKKIIK